MPPKPRSPSLKRIAWTLVFSMAGMAIAQPRAEAMLVPSTAVKTTGTIHRGADLQTIQTTLESKAIRGKLHAMGLSDAEIQTRLSRLSDTQVHQLASQIRAVNPAGDVLIGLLVAVVLVLLIIYLLKKDRVVC